MQKINLFGLEIANITLTQTVNLIEEHLKHQERCTIFTPNTEFIIDANEDNTYCKILNKADILVPDGMPLIWVSHLLGTPLKEKVSGSTLFFKICELANKHNNSIYLLGGDEGVAIKAAININQKYPNIKILGTKYVPFGFDENEKYSEQIINELNLLKPDIFIIGLGKGQGERWIIKNQNKFNSIINIQLGGAISFAAGYYKMPPEVFKKYGFAWLWQLIEQPSRQWKRPLRGLKIFYYLISKNKLKK